MENKEEILRQINQKINNPEGKQAIRFVLNALGGIPAVGGVFSASSNLWSEKEQTEFNNQITQWAEQTNIDLAAVLALLKDQLRKPTKSNFKLLLKEVLNVHLPPIYPKEGNLGVNTILHGETLNEFKKYEERGWIIITSTGSMTNMGAGNQVGNAIEDKKRPYGMGNGYFIEIKEEFYEN